MQMRLRRIRDGAAVAVLLVLAGGAGTVTGGPAVATTPSLASLTVVKNTIGGDGTFGFDGDLGSFDITTAGGAGSRLFDGIDPGSYGIFEALPSGWSLDGFECDAVFVSGSGAIGVSVNVPAGEDVTCTFTNSLIANPGTITVVKNAVGGDATFDFASSFGNFQISTSGGTGSYSQEVTATGHSVQEWNQPSGWTVDGITCDADFVVGPGSNEVSFDVEHGTDVTCAFSNSTAGPPAAASVTVSFSPENPSPGTRIAVTGSGCNPGEQVAVHIWRVEGDFWPTASTADASGGFAVDAALPADLAPGEEFWLSVICADDVSRYAEAGGRAGAAATTTVPAAAPTSSAPPPLTADPAPPTQVWIVPQPYTKIPEVYGGFEGGVVDFFDMFAPDAPWETAAERVDVFEIFDHFGIYPPLASREQWLTAIDGISDRGMALAIESGALPDTGECGGGEGYGRDDTLAALRRVQAMGGRVDIVVWDSPFGVAHFGEGGPDHVPCAWSMEEIAAHTAEFVRLAREIEPDLIIGTVEQTWPQISAADTAAWLLAHAEAAGEPLAFLHLDIDWSRQDWAEHALEMEAEARARGIQFGIIYNGQGHDTSNEAWTQAAADRAYLYEEVHGGRPDHVIFQSWHPYPDHALPDTDPTTHTGLVNRYFGDRSMFDAVSLDTSEGDLVVAGQHRRPLSAYSCVCNYPMAPWLGCPAQRWVVSLAIGTTRSTQPRSQ